MSSLVYTASRVTFADDVYLVITYGDKEQFAPTVTFLDCQDYADDAQLVYILDDARYNDENTIPLHSKLITV